MLLVVIMHGMYIVCVYAYVFLFFVWHHITQCSYEANVSCPNDSWIFFWFKHNSNKRKGKQSVGYKLLYKVLLPFGVATIVTGTTWQCINWNY